MQKSTNHFVKDISYIQKIIIIICVSTVDNFTILKTTFLLLEFLSLNCKVVWIELLQRPN